MIRINENVVVVKKIYIYINVKINNFNLNLPYIIYFKIY